MTADESACVEDTTKAIAELDTKIASARHDLFVLQQARELADTVGAPVGADDSTSSGIAEKSRRLSFKGIGAGIAKQMVGDGTKALAPSGAAVVAQEFAPDPVPLGRPVNSLLSVLPVTVHRSPDRENLFRRGGSPATMCDPA